MWKYSCEGDGKVSATQTFAEMLREERRDAREYEWAEFKRTWKARLK